MQFCGRFYYPVILAGLMAGWAPSLSAAEAGGSAGNDPSPLVVVAGATGKTGRLTLGAAGAKGYRLRALARDPERARQEIGDSFEWVRADVRDADSLRLALQGATYVICAIGATERSGPNSPEFVDYGGVRNLTDAAREAGVRHLVLVSSVGVDGGGGVFSWILNTLIMPGILDWKAKGEDHLRSSGVPYTILRPGGLTDDEGGKIGIRIAPRGLLGGGTIARADVAAVAVHVLGRTDAVGRTLELSGDDKAPVLSWQQLLTSVPIDEPPGATSR